MDSVIRIGTRGSRLAIWQADDVAARLARAGITSEKKVIVTKGDVDRDTPLPELGDKGLFTAELDLALLEGSIDLAVHSLKDLPTVLSDGLALAAVPVRAAPWDVLVARTTEVTSLEDLPQDAVIATGSLRRAAQLRAWRPGIRIASVRGNVETRLATLETSDWDGMILAEAGLVRLGLGDRITESIDPRIMLPGVAQGALGIVMAWDRMDAFSDMIRLLDDPFVHQVVRTERAFLRTLQGGCQVPIGALARRVDVGVLRLEGFVASLDGSRIIRGEQSGPENDPESLGSGLAQELIDRGAADVLASFHDQSR